MRIRSRSIRAKIVALLLVPLVSLTGVWTWTTATSVDQVWGLVQVSSDYRWFGTPADDLSRALQDERRAAVAYVAAAVGKGDRAALQKAEAATDQQVAVFQEHATDGGRLDDLTGAQKLALQGIQAQIGGLTMERAQVSGHKEDWDETFTWYTGAQDPFFNLRLAMSNFQAGDLTREAGNLIELVRAREYLSEEDALMYGARATGFFSSGEYQQFLTVSDGERLLFQVHVPQLPDQEQTLFQDFTTGEIYTRVNSLEAAVSTLDAQQAPKLIDGAAWVASYGTALSQLSQLDTQSATLAGNRARSYAMGVIWRAVAVGLIGLLAVVLTLVLSLRIGRGLVRELVGLRDDAFDLAGVRLPEVMRRLRGGERVDLAAEVPQVTVRPSGNDEIAQVGRAFNAVQRAAVEAAVEQADLRRGVAAVFVNLARRSQALLHRQLTLLDEMERRADDPDELEDLFRLDHLTTRMRRHAEGLIILSGSAPGRNWRRPVRILDVVRAAVGEVEDYARVRVHRMPQVAVVGGAVSDIVHMIAELVENAAVFSPPHTQVRVQGEEVANGFVLEIDDRGLGMGEEAMAAANERLATGGDFDLSDTDRLGLFVISRLSARHGVKVSLRRSPYGGTTAVVLLPRELITEVPSRGGDAPVEESEATAEHPLPANQLQTASLQVTRSRTRRELPTGTGGGTGAGEDGQPGGPGTPGDPGPQRRRSGPRHAAPFPAAVPEVLEVPGQEQGLAALPKRRPVSSRADSYLAARDASLREAPVREVPVREASVREAPVSDPAPLLPRRVRQASLAPQLRVAAQESGAEHAEHTDPGGPAQPAVRERSPEEVRATFSSFQRGLSRGRGRVGAEQGQALPADDPHAARADAAPEPSAEGPSR
ncbi:MULTISPECIES: nitrate- and nitrite sensing domain-containing protein [Streptacidiphilus]|uniref:histidine kinase n=1 Tax=Streptacidiphilus cavernicola TaxID=3342716 RepID=A0ABV6UQA3_9ACTN|nr:nitrate- and nitrite sensing domain-containing protein [Streptacidiphilus jeojiense]